MDPRGFKGLMGSLEIIPVIGYLETSKIYYERLRMDTKLEPHFVQVGIASREASQFMLERLSWTIFVKRMKRNIYEKKNTDIRVAFTWDSNNFLVKFGFTFGLRRVRPGCRHIFQTTTSPLVIYLLSTKARAKVLIVERYFRAKDQYHFDIGLNPIKDTVSKKDKYIHLWLPRRLFSEWTWWIKK